MARSIGSSYFLYLLLEAEICRTAFSRQGLPIVSHFHLEGALCGESGFAHDVRANFFALGRCTADRQPRAKKSPALAGDCALSSFGCLARKVFGFSRMERIRNLEGK